MQNTVFVIGPQWNIPGFVGLGIFTVTLVLAVWFWSSKKHIHSGSVWTVLIGVLSTAMCLLSLFGTTATIFSPPFSGESIVKEQFPGAVVSEKSTSFITKDGVACLYEISPHGHNFFKISVDLTVNCEK